jgi:hypothetical protein
MATLVNADSAPAVLSNRFSGAAPGVASLSATMEKENRWIIWIPPNIRDEFDTFETFDLNSLDVHSGR